MDDRPTDVVQLPTAPPNLAGLAAGPFADGVHVRLKLNYDVTNLSEDKQKLLLHMVTGALEEFRNAVNVMDRITAAARLARFERAKSMKGNGQ